MARFLTDEQFTEIWQSSQDPREVMRRTGLFYKSVVQRATKLRRLGYNLKRFPIMTKAGHLQGKNGVMTWLKEKYPQVYKEWKETGRQ